MPFLPVLVAVLSACLMTVTVPACALAIGIESYFRRKLRRLETAIQ